MIRRRVGIYVPPVLNFDGLKELAHTAHKKHVKLAATLSGEHRFAALPAIGLGLLSMFLLLAIFGEIDDPVLSLLATTIACGLGLVAIAGFHYRRRLGNSIVALALVIFVVKVGIGVVHYLYFFEPNYFTQPLDHFWWSYDYGQLPEAMQLISRFWKLWGFVGVPETYLGRKAFFLVIYHSFLYYVSGEHTLNLTPWASFHTILSAFLIASLALRWWGATPKQARFAFVVSALLPLYLYSDLPQRDIVGQFWIVLAVYLLINSLSSLPTLLTVLPVSIILVHSQRTVYPLALVIFVLASLYIIKRRWQTLLLVVAVSTFTIVLIPQILELTRLNYYIVAPSLTSRPLGLQRTLLHLIIGFLGPFPWTQVFEFPENWVVYPVEFVQCWLALAVWMIVLPRVLKQWRNLRTLDLGLLAAIPFFMTGVASDAVHTGYTNIGIVFLLPMACQAPVRQWVQKLVLSAYVYCIAHLVFFALGLHGEGLFL